MIISKLKQRIIYLSWDILALFGAFALAYQTQYHMKKESFFHSWSSLQGVCMGTQSCRLFATHQALLSMEFSMQEY